MDIQKIMADVQSLRSEVSFPITKQELITLAENKSVSDDLKGLIHSLPDQQFNSFEEIKQSLPLSNLEGEAKDMLSKFM